MNFNFIFKKLKKTLIETDARENGGRRSGVGISENRQNLEKLVGGSWRFNFLKMGEIVASCILKGKKACGM